MITCRKSLPHLLLLLGAGAIGCAAPRPSPWTNQALPGMQGPSIEMPGANPQPATAQADDSMIIRGQSPGYGPSYGGANETTPGSTNYTRGPMPISGGQPATTPGYPSAYAAPTTQPAPINRYQTEATTQQPAFPSPQPAFAPPPLPPPPADAFQPANPYQPGNLNVAPQGTPLPPPGSAFGPTFPWFTPPSNIPQTAQELGPPPTATDLDIFVEETRTGRFMFGVGVNSDAGVTGQITIDERNFDISRYPTSFDDVLNGTALRGAGQGFRMEAQPGNRVQRYLISFTNPYLFSTNVSLSTSAFYYDRNYFDWTESRYGGRLGFGYRLTPDLSTSFSLRAENVNIFDPRVLGVEELDRSLGNTDLFSGTVQLAHDTRDLPFMPTEGHLLQMSYEQAFGSFDYPRGEIDYYQYFMLRERPDGTGRHTLAFSSRVGVTGSQTPIFENYFAGGFSTLRGYSFRGASPVDNSVRVGGEFRFLNSVEYFFPLTADDMIKGVVFCDFGTIEEKVQIKGDNFRVAPGFGLRIAVPALGPAPLALDFAFPVASAPGDDEQTFSFFFGASRGQ